MVATIVKETGQGLEGANSYISLDDFKAYCSARGYDITQKTDDQMTIMILESTQNTDTRFVEQYIGERYSANQGLEWPRTKATGSYTKKPYNQPVMPNVLLNQTAERAYRLLINELGFVSKDYQSERIVTSESKSLSGVGSKSQTFEDSKSRYVPTTTEQLQSYLTGMLKDILKRNPVVGHIGLVRSL